ncbi:endolytic transglycosylase MltG [Variovorax sp. WS11]|uniref:endolytic transglycosylase MltG n=1 Tax=Variovorax sp. WS11 TaxID=1105204 RepID=UPI000D0CE84C|nr:endolytic transglycosylase MltG [Variovorax sp. WS11]NDZ16577.1 endolytic transglycosylase MltG [Variovorax sp. WS11]PSL85938.1 endolytic transglycosylase MltG [Variovorax sp. WS11]
MRRFLLTLFLLAAFVVLGSGAAGLWWVQAPLKLPAPTVDLSVEPGTTPRGVAQAVVEAGVDVPWQLLYGWFRFSGQDRQIRAGSYELERGVTPRLLLNMLVRGEEATRSIVLVEGWSFRQIRAALAKAEQLKPETVGQSDQELMARLGKPGVHPEGRFFPDTYTYSKNSTDLAVLQRAMRAMDKKLEAAWAARAADLPLKTADEALILASIVEKETGVAKDRAEIAAVFVNRLRAGMPLQTDPTVIYGMGTRFDGNLRKKDLQADTPWNTYLRPGLPPTPIAMPGKAALLAAVQPAQSKSLYFVSRGDGSSHFSSSLDEHNRAVNRYQRGIEQPVPRSEQR